MCPPWPAASYDMQHDALRPLRDLDLRSNF